MTIEYKLKAIFFSILFLVAGGIVLFFYHYKKTHTVPEEIYVEDYSEIYAEEFRIIFGEDCEIGEKKFAILAMFLSGKPFGAIL